MIVNMDKRFQRTIEHFTCEICDRHIEGDGYTNHCPHCLWSKHVDVHPGDRQAECGGMMKPVDVETEKGNQIITHECVECGHRKRNSASWNDKFDALLDVVRARNELNESE